MIFSLLSRNYFVQSFIAKVRPVFIKVDKFAGPLGSNPKKAETEMVSIDEYYKVL